MTARRRGSLLAACALAFFSCVSDRAMEGEETVKVVIETDLGDIEVALYPERAPLTAANFLGYVDAGLYEGGRFHRTVTTGNQPNDAIRIEVVQAGPDPSRSEEIRPPIPLERTSRTGLRHLDGTISMARLGPDTAVADFFVCVGDQAELDFGGRRNPDGQGFAAFGRVTKGMDVVRRIHSSPAAGQKLDPPIRISRVSRKR